MKADVLGKGVKAVCFLGVGEGHPHARGEGGVKDHSSALKARRQVQRGHGVDDLPVQDDVLGADAVPDTKRSTFKTGFVIGLETFCPKPSRTGTARFFCLPGAQGVPGCIDISVKVLLRRLASADTVARVIVRKNVAVDAGAQADVKAAHLAQVDCITVGKQDRKPEEEERGNT